MHVRQFVASLPAYLAMEEAETEHRHEYWDGDVWAMAGTSLEHNDLVFAFVRLFREQLAGGPCRANSESIRTRISERKYVYPDVVVACPPQLDNTRRPPTLVNPKIIVEVLSESTASFDRGDKLKAYYAVPSIEEVVLADSEAIEVEHHRRRPDGTWLVRILGPKDTLAFESLPVRTEVGSLYAAIATLS